MTTKKKMETSRKSNNNKNERRTRKKRSMYTVIKKPGRAKDTGPALKETQPYPGAASANQGNPVPTMLQRISNGIYRAVSLANKKTARK